MNTMYSSENDTLPQECSSALKNFLNFKNYKSHPSEYNQYIKIIQNTCPTMFYFPNVPILFGDIYFAYRKDDFQQYQRFTQTSFYICYNQSRYGNHFSNLTKIMFNNTPCIHSERFIVRPLLMRYPSILEHLHACTIN